MSLDRHMEPNYRFPRLPVHPLSRHSSLDWPVEFIRQLLSHPPPPNDIGTAQDSKNLLLDVNREHVPYRRHSCLWRGFSKRLQARMGILALHEGFISSNCCSGHSRVTQVHGDGYEPDPEYYRCLPVRRGKA